VKPVLPPIGSLNFQKKKKNPKTGVKPGLASIGILHFQKKFENPV
jgi:hypothetical protein